MVFISLSKLPLISHLISLISHLKKRFCHVDDDNYVNINSLMELLSKFNHNEFYFLGKLRLSQ